MKRQAEKLLNRLTAQVNAGTVDVLAALDAAALVQKITTTNNGYLFAPSPGERHLAKQHPEIFLVTESAGVGRFPHRIALNA